MSHRNSDDWEKAFTECEAFWRHSGDPAEPYMRLSSRLISDGYFNMSKVAENNPKLYGEACEALWACTSSVSPQYGRIIGPAVGGIALAQRLGEAAGLKSGHTQVIDDGHVFVRQHFDYDEGLIMVDDTLTTGRTFRKLQKAALAVNPGVLFAPFVLVMCDRSPVEGCISERVICLIRPVFKTWVDGRNPHTDDGHEIVPPIAAAKLNWNKIAPTSMR